jgi:heme-degrading monooxygenase HmoA
VGAEWHVAQVNISLAVDAIDSAAMRGFVRMAGHAISQAERAPGFVWRSDGAPTTISFAGEDDVVVNLSVWRSVAELEAYVHDRSHAVALRRRHEWFHQLDRPSTALWWVPAGHRPTMAEAESALLRLWGEGPSRAVFGYGTGPAPAPPA